MLIFLLRSTGNQRISSYFKELFGKIKHVHLSDASYPYNEGLQLGAGSINFKELPSMDDLPVFLKYGRGMRMRVNFSKKRLILYDLQRAGSREIYEQ